MKQFEMKKKHQLTKTKSLASAKKLTHNERRKRNYNKNDNSIT